MTPVVRLSQAAYAVLRLDRIPAAVYGLTRLRASGDGAWYAVTDPHKVAVVAQCLMRWGGAVHRHHPVATLARRLAPSMQEVA